jgi:hypothetical protein
MKKYLVFVKPTLYLIYFVFFFAFIPQIQPIQTGLDPSWSYGISQAGQNNWIFGKDIIFTYGPLGYLVGGAFLEANLWQILFFRWFVYLGFFVISIIRIETITQPVYKIFFGTSIVLCLLTELSIDYTILFSYIILFSYLIILTFDRVFEKYPRLLPLLLGMIAGFSFLTKFTLGVSILGSLIIFLSVNLIQAIIAKSRERIINNIFALINGLLGTVTSLWLLFIPSNFNNSFKQIFVNVFLTSILTISFILWQKSNNYHQFRNNNRLLKINQVENLLPYIIFYIIYSLLLIKTIISNPNIPILDYFKNSWEISSGYSSTMSIIGNNQEFALGVSQLFILLWILFLIAKNGQINFSLTMLFISWISFKHGFVRHDSWHIIAFYQTMLFLIPLSALKITKLQLIRVIYFLYAYVVFTFLLVTFPYFPSLNSSVLANINSRIVNNIIYITDLNKLKLDTNKISNENLASLKLPEEVTKKIGKKTVDIIPWEISLAPANNLNWKPRPIFQSYTAYTSHLDNLNFESLSTNPRDFILYSFQSIDYRHPFFDEPKSFSFVYCNYHPSIIASGGYNVFALLEKLPKDRCQQQNINKTISLTWNTPKDLENIDSDSIILAKIKFSYSLFGKIYKIIFRAPPVYINVQYADNPQVGFSYRIIPENAENGVIINNLPRDSKEAIAFLLGNKVGNVKSFSFRNMNSLLYKNKIDIEYKTLK